MFYSLLLKDFKLRDYALDVEMKTLHCSINEVDYEVCDLDKGINRNFLPLVKLKIFIDDCF